MKRVLLVVSAVLLSVSSVFALTGRQIVDKSDELKEANSGKSKVKMIIHKGGSVFEKEFKTIGKKFGGNDKALISFTKPTRIKLLTHSHKNRDDDQWLKLSSGKIKRIASSDKGKPFVNSHFFYEDLQSREKNDYNYKNLGDAKAVGEVCYKVESVKKVSGKVYSKSIMYFRKSDFFVLKVEFYNKKGKFIKYLENYNIKKIKGILTPMKVVMYQANGKGKTILLLKKKPKYNIKISSSKFSKGSL